MLASTAHHAREHPLAAKNRAVRTVVHKGVRKAFRTKSFAKPLPPHRRACVPECYSLAGSHVNNGGKYNV